MSEKKTIYKQYDGQLFYAKTFESNRDNHPKYHAKTDGQYSIVLVPNEETIAQMKADGLPQTAMNYPMFKPLAEADGRISYKFKRPHRHRSVEEFGGPPRVMNWTDGVDNSRPWDEDTDGLIGNGSEGSVRISFYTDGDVEIVRLEGVAVTDLVPFELSEEAQSRAETEEGWV